MKSVLIILILFSQNIFAKDKTTGQMLHVRELKLNKDKKSYKVSFKEKAAIYKSEKKWLTCLLYSVEKKRSVKIASDPRNLNILNCEIIKEK